MIFDQNKAHILKGQRESRHLKLEVHFAELI